MSLPPLDCLRFFEAAARLRSFAHAGKELGVTPPAVAPRIRMLESYLGAELFGRGRRSVRLNRRGRAVTTRRSGASSSTSTRPPSASATLLPGEGRRPVSFTPPAMSAREAAPETGA